MKRAACDHFWEPVSAHVPIGPSTKTETPPRIKVLMVCVMCLSYSSAEARYLGYDLDAKTLAAQRERRKQRGV